MGGECNNKAIHRPLLVLMAELSLSTIYLYHGMGMGMEHFTLRTSYLNHTSFALRTSYLSYFVYTLYAINSEYEGIALLVSSARTLSTDTPSFPPSRDLRLIASVLPGSHRSSPG